MNGVETEHVTLPVEIIDLLVQIALRTEAGSALVTGFRAGHPALTGRPGRLEIRIAHPAQIKLEQQ
jgi:hypothetical protein